MSTPMRWVPALLASPYGDRLQCDVCPRRCRLSDGQVGYCQVRRRTGDAMQTATFAMSVAHTDAVERKPLYHWRPGSAVLTLAAPGCSFRCGYCINFGLSQLGRRGGDAWSAEEADPVTLVETAVRRRCAIGFSYTEPSLAIELTLALAEAGTARNVPVLWKSNGFFTPELVELAAPAVWAMNIDVKAADDRAHRRLTGGALAPVFESIAALRAKGVWLEISTPLIPGTSADDAQIATIAGTLADIDPGMPWHLLRFTPTFRMTDSSPTSPADLARATRIGRDAGLRHVYVERALGDAGRATVCPQCTEVCVERGIWSTAAVHLVDGRCPGCGTAIEGVWS